MFEDALFATNRRRTPQQPVAAVLSFVLQAALVTVLVALPLFFTEALPVNLTNIHDLPAVPHPAGPPPGDPGPKIRPEHPTTEFAEGKLVFHSAAKGPIKPIVDDRDTDAAEACTGVCVPGGTGTDRGDNTLLKNILGSGKDWSAPKPPVGPTKAVRVSVIDEGLLIHKVTPVYPPLAIAARQQGAVLLHAIIGRDGRVQQLQVVSGPPLLIRAAMEAVTQWRYRPYVLNGDPVEVDTTITVNFRLGG